MVHALRTRSVDRNTFMAVPATIRAVLDSVQSNVFVADLDLRLVYANRRALDTCRTFEGELRAAFGIGVDDLLHGSIHRFHRDPARVERILRQPSNLPHRAQFSFGGVTLETNVAGVYGDDGALRGYCVAWDDVSAQNRLRAEVRRVADELATSGEDLTLLSGRLSEDAVMTAEQVGAAAAATEEMNASIQEIARSSSSTVERASDGVTSARTAADRIAALADAAEEIGGVVELVTSIAAQTNLLALNATIEAARAGEAGRGFAVVAGEVKALARETAEATDRITSMIDTLRAGSSEATATILQVTRLVDRISADQEAVAGAIAEQSTATGEVSRNVTEVSAIAERTNEDVGTLAADAQRIRDVVHRLRGLLTELEV